MSRSIGTEGNHYRLLKTLGEGTFGVAYLARNLDTKEIVVLKKVKIRGAEAVSYTHLTLPTTERV